MADIEFITIEDGIGLVTLNRPHRKNAFTAAMRAELIAVLNSPELQKTRAVILTGAEDTFSAGADLKEMRISGETEDVSDATQLFTAFRRANPVIIAAVRKYALGLGSGVAMAADLVIAGDDAQFGYPEISHGLVAGITMVRLKELVGDRMAMELIITGRRVVAEEALQLGMVNKVVPTDRTIDEAKSIARQIAGYSPLAVHTSKKFFYETSDMPYSTALNAGERVIALMRTSKDAKAGAAKFVKRDHHEELEV